MRFCKLTALACALLASHAALAAPAAAEPTQVIVRALAKDAKFIGDSMGGVAVTLTDAASGQVLASGHTKGGTGDTAKLVKTPRVRGEAISTPDAAAFTATLDIDKPTLVRAEAAGPAGKVDSAITVTSMMWVLPGRPVDGDGWILEMPGLVIEPSWTQSVGGPMTVTAKVSPMCGCPIEAGGLWDAARYTVVATVFDKTKAVAEASLVFTGKTSVFSGELPALAPGGYRLRLVATDSGSTNTGAVERVVEIPGPGGL